MTRPSVRSKDERASARRRGYDAAHEKWRASVLARERTCKLCGAAGQPSDHADHIKSIRSGGARFDPANGQRLCRTCHSGPKQSFERTGIERGTDSSGIPLDPAHHWNSGAVNLLHSAHPAKSPAGGRDLAIPENLLPSRIPLTIVYGPPASGKTTYVKAHAAPTDLIIDLDPIKQELSGLPWYEAGEEWVAPALVRRNELLRSLSGPPTHTAAWFIVTAAWASHRRRWAELLRPHHTVMLDTPADECIARVHADPRRAARIAEHTTLINLWWDRYSADAPWKRAQASGSAPLTFVLA